MTDKVQFNGVEVAVGDQVVAENEDGSIVSFVVTEVRLNFIPDGNTRLGSDALVIYSEHGWTIIDVVTPPKESYEVGDVVPKGVHLPHLRNTLVAPDDPAYVPFWVDGDGDWHRLDRHGPSPWYADRTLPGLSTATYRVAHKLYA